MVQRRELDDRVTMAQQFASGEDGSIVLINVFNVAPEDVDQLITAWAADSAHFKSQPGYISAQLHRGIAGSTTFVNVAVWQSLAHFHAAHKHPGFMEKLKEYPSSAVAAPHIFKKVAVDGICVA